MGAPTYGLHPAGHVCLSGLGAAGGRAGGGRLGLRRPRYAGSASSWAVAIYRTSHDDHENSILQRLPDQHPQEALDCACGLYLGDPPPGSAHHPDRLTGPNK